MSHDEPDDDVIAYAHPSGVFSLGYPAGWAVADTSTTGQIATSLRCADPPILVQLTIQMAPADDSDAAMEALIRQFVAQQAGHHQGFALDDPTFQPDDSVWASYRYNAAGRTTVGDALVWTDEPLVMSLAVEQDEGSVEVTQPLVDDLIERLLIDPSVPLP